MEKQHMKKCTTSVAIWKMQITTTRDIITHLLNDSKKKELTMPSTGGDAELWDLSYVAGRTAKLYCHSGKLFDSFL